MSCALFLCNYCKCISDYSCICRLCNCNFNQTAKSATCSKSGCNCKHFAHLRKQPNNLKFWFPHIIRWRDKLVLFNFVLRTLKLFSKFALELIKYLFFVRIESLSLISFFLSSSRDANVDISSVYTPQATHSFYFPMPT